MRQAEFRALFPVTQERIFLNHAAYSPMSDAVVKAMDEFFAHWQMGNPKSWDIAEAHLEGLRRNHAALSGTSPERIAMMTNTVTGVNVLANGLDWEAGDEILLYKDEFPSNVMPFLNLESRGVIVKFLEAPGGLVTPELFEAAITPRTRLISISSVQYLTGYRCDLAAFGQLCRDHNIIFSVDAIQSIGVIPMDVEAVGIDFMAVGGHKWLMSPLGAGYLYVTEDLQSRLKLADRGYMGHVNPIDFGNFYQDLSPHARRFELGAFNAPSIVGAERATELLLDCGVDHIQKHVSTLLDQFRQGLDRLPYNLLFDFSVRESSGILLFSHDQPEKNQAIWEYLTANGVNLSLRGGGLRIAPHYYNVGAELEQLLDLLKDFN